eukprot:TRINITY_DN17279_c0_g1_i1.p2 TRINITY_DN17279_c0_g1~~TRINITY_DN17279_c0_g1_i1.p2  ORF type:complete len:143 (-),score=25.19 TRINITY_DN17279_c0_g1_i1:306-734(-)
MERTNLRTMEASRIPELCDLATLDLSFISLLSVLPSVSQLLKPDGRIVALIKPQFEARRDQVGEGGLVRDPEVHSQVLSRVISGVETAGFASRGWIPSPIKGTQGNTEFLAYFERSSEIVHYDEEPAICGEAVPGGEETRGI